MSFEVPINKRVRVILNTDAKNEADDQYAIVHTLLTPKFIIKGLIGAHFGNHFSDDTMLQSYEECKHVVDLMHMSDAVNVYKGAKKCIADDGTYEYSEGAKLIVKEALSDDPSRLFVAFLGPITDLACAYLKHPEIVGKLTAIWIGGGMYPEGHKEFNLSNDINAANIVFQSGIDLWQVPMNVYAKMMVSLTELEMKVKPCGEIGKYLFCQMAEFNTAQAGRSEWPNGESWSLGDSPVVGLMMDPMICCYDMREAPLIDKNMKYHFSGKGNLIRVYNDINVRFILEDFFMKLKKFSDDQGNNIEYRTKY